MLNIKVAGPGCPNCQKLETLCKEVIDEEGMNANIEKITDTNEISELGILMTPGLLVNDEVLSSGKIPNKPTLKHWLQDRASVDG